MATAGASTTTFGSAVTTPSDAARRLIAKPASADDGVGAKSSAGRRTAVIACDHRLTEDEAAGDAQLRMWENGQAETVSVIGLMMMLLVFLFRWVQLRLIQRYINSL